MADMFEAMLRSSRFNSKPPEFLITHPLTESRVSDAKLRAQQFSRKQEKQSLNYQLVRTRAAVLHSNNLANDIVEYEEQLKGNTLYPLVARYGLALGLFQLGDITQAKKEFELLLEHSKSMSNAAQKTITYGTYWRKHMA